MTNDLRLIEDYLPIEAISREATREKSIRKGHISTLHLWWARRPLVACRAAVYGALVPADRWVTEVNLKNPPADPAKAEAMKEGAKRGLNRKAAGEFVEALCKYPGEPHFIQKAQEHILDAHADRLTAELAEGHASGGEQMPAWVEEFNWPANKKSVTRADIEAGRAPRPRVLDMFAGGGAIPLEALRLGCEAYALELNPVAHIIELCTLVYPQKYGKPDPNSRGMTGPKCKDGKPTWGGLAEEVRYWGNWVLGKVKAEIGDLYPLIPDPAYEGRKPKKADATLWKTTDKDDIPPGYLIPVAYLWTRTVRCKDPSCGATVPLVRQTWLCKKKGRYVALRMIVPRGQKHVRFQVIQHASESQFDFDPSAFSRAQNATCPFCGTVADSDYVKAEGHAKRFGQQLMAVVVKRLGKKGKEYLSPDNDSESLDIRVLAKRLNELSHRLGITVPDEPLEANPRSFDVQRFGFRHWRDILAPRQIIAMTCFAGLVRESHAASMRAGQTQECSKAISCCLGMILGRLGDYCTSFCTWQPEFVAHMYDSPGLPMIVDYAEANPIVKSSGSWPSAIDYVVAALGSFEGTGLPASVCRGSALSTNWADASFDAIVTDPPYYDSRSYSNLADHFYVWHKRAIGEIFAEHFASQLTPKKNEVIAAKYRHDGSKDKADRAYEVMMQESFEECHRLLKPAMPLVCVYAHKTTAGWSTIINALMRSGFTVVEAWPVEMERKVRKNAQDTAALASSIFLVARKRSTDVGVAKYEDDVQPELERIVRERVDTLWGMGISGADLVIAAVGAGLRAFTKYERVEYANGEEVPAEKFLAEVEGVVLDCMMEQIAGKGGRGVSAVDAPSRFYVLWRYVYKAAPIDAGEAIVFTYGQQVELDGRQGLSTGKDALLEKKKAKYRLRDYTERGQDDKLGLPEEDGQPAPLVDVLHRAVWLMENRPARLGEFLNEARPNREQLRLLAAALAGPALSGKSEEDAKRLIATTAPEQTALGKLLAHWKTLVPESLFDAAAT